MSQAIKSTMQGMHATRGRARQFWAVFDTSLVPMVTVDGQRSYLRANAAARLVFRLSLEELQARRIDDLTPPHMQATLESRWQRLVRHGTVSGAYDVRFPDNSAQRILYCALRNALPGQHLIVFTPADWPEDELILAGEVSAAPVEGSSPVPRGQLSPREREVLSLVAVGATLPQIADELTLSHSTVRTHARNAQAKLGARNRAHAIALAMRDALIDAPAEAPGQATSSD